MPNIDDNSDKSLGDIASRNVAGILDIGTMEDGVSTEENADPAKTQSQAMMRYNSIFTQSLKMTVSSNTNLEVGMIIKCKFPKVTREGNKTDDSEQSGLYMIKELCHHFDSSASYTSLQLIKDTYGER